MKSNKEVLNLPFVGITTFGKYPLCDNLDNLDADVAILGAPYDMGTQYRPGARMGPRAIRSSSTNESFGLEGSYDPERDEIFLGPPWKIVDCGDADMIHGDLKQCFENIETSVRKIVSKGAIQSY